MHEPIRVAQVMGKMKGGGVEAVVMNYFRNIDHRRVQFDFLVDEDSTFVPRDEIEALGGRVFIVPPYQQLSRYFFELTELFNREHWSIVQSHITALSVFPLCAAARAKVPIRIAHGHNTTGSGEPVKNAIKSVLRTQANRYPTHRVACSHRVGRWLFGKSAPYTIVHNAINLERFSFDAEVRAQMRADLGLTANTFAVGHVSRFAYEKNHCFLIDAFADLVRMHPDSVLLLAFAGEQRARVESHAAELEVEDKVRFLGLRTDANLLYQAFDVFVLPSLREGLGLVGIEAQRAGLPCLLSDTITGEVDVTRTCEFLPIDDPQVWSDALLRVAEAAEHNRSLLGMDECFADYDITKAAPKLTAYYEQLVAEAFGNKQREMTW